MNEQDKLDSLEYLEKGSLEETMLGPLWARATLSQKFPEILEDPKAIEIIGRLHYDFSAIQQLLGDWRGIGLLARARNLDDAVRDYVKIHPEAIIVNIGAGLDTTFHRIDNGTITWYDLDMPDAIEFRKRLIPETSRSKCIASSVFDHSWMDEIDYNAEKGMFLIAGGFFYYFSEEKVAQLFDILAKRFPGGGIAFDTVNKIAGKILNKRAKKYDSDLSISLVIGKPEKILLKWSNHLKINNWYTIYSRIVIKPNWPKKTVKLIKMNERLNISKIVILEFI